MKKRFIEWDLPLAEISEEFLREFKIDEDIRNRLHNACISSRLMNVIN